MGASADLNFAHPPRGTCFPECPLYGWCHDQCGKRTTICDASHKRRLFVKDRPYSYVKGHNSGHEGIWAKRGVPIERVRPLALWLKDRYGIRGAAALMEMSMDTLNHVLYERKKVRATPWVAERIVETVMAHRRGQSSPLDEEPEVRLPLPAQVDEMRRKHTREERAKYRRAS